MTHRAGADVRPIDELMWNNQLMKHQPPTHVVYVQEVVLEEEWSIEATEQKIKGVYNIATTIIHLKIKMFDWCNTYLFELIKLVQIAHSLVGTHNRWRQRSARHTRLNTHFTIGPPGL